MEALMRTSTHVIGPVAVVLPPRANKVLITFCRAIHHAMLNNPGFPSPNPPLAVFKANIDAFDDAETNAATRANGATTFRDARKKTVKQDLFHLCDYVQSVVEATPDPADAAALIKSAFMSIRKAPTQSISEISAKNAEVSGKVVLAAKAVAPAATYSWEYSLDQSTWTPVPNTMQCRTKVSGLTSACTYYFRFRALTRTGLRDYSQVVSLLVH
jgi:hypothetical protein